MSLYTQEEINKYFDGDDNIGARAEIFERWRSEWQDRCIVVPKNENRDVKLWIAENSILQTDFSYAWFLSGHYVNFYFRYDEDYLAAVLKFI